MLTFFVSFLILLNPFALFIYLLPLKKERGFGQFIQILVRASIISYVIYALFAIMGQSIFKFLSIDFEAFRIFGGIVLVGFALSFILQGKQSMITTRGELNKIAAEVALPFIVGAGTITFSIIIGEAVSSLAAALIIAAVMVANLLIITCIAFIRHNLKPRFKIVFDKNAEVILRLNGFIVGAYGVNLIIAGVNNLR